MIDYEFYETPDPYTLWLLSELCERAMIPGQAVLFEPCVGNGAITRASNDYFDHAFGHPPTWITNDIDTRWQADFHLDAAAAGSWQSIQGIDWTISNPPFSLAIEILEQALAHSDSGVAMHFRASINEPLKTGKRRSFFREHPPTGVMWLPRFAYQRSRTKGKWTTDSVTACWMIWTRHDWIQPFILYPPDRVFAALDEFTPAYRERMDALNGLSGSESDKERQWVQKWKGASDEEPIALA